MTVRPVSCRSGRRIYASRGTKKNSYKYNTCVSIEYSIYSMSKCTFSVKYMHKSMRKSACIDIEYVFVV